MKSIEYEVKLEIKHHVPIRKKVKAIQDYLMSISNEEFSNKVLKKYISKKKLFKLCFSRK